MKHNLTFVEYLQYRDPVLHDELLNEVNLKQLGLSALTTLGLMGNPYNTQAGTPTSKQINTAAEDNYKDPIKSKDEDQFNRRMAFGGHKLDNIFNKKKSTQNRATDMKNRANTIQPQNFRSGVSLNHIEDNYKPEEILFRKIVNPYEIIKSNIPDPEKFEKDYNNLKSNPNDIGFTMNKDSLMNNRVLLVIVTDKAMKRVASGAEGYAGKMSTLEDPDTNIRTIFLPKSAVKEIKYGKITLTKEGEQTFRHEARHNAQEGDPGERHQGAMPTSEKGWFKHYMNDPREIGVRLGELKNHLSTKTLLQLTKGTTHYNNINQLLKDVKGNEKELLKLFMTPSGQYQNTIKYVKEKLANSNEDMGSLFNHYDELSDKEKSILMQELLDNYDNVVHAKTNKTNNI
jgi:hypothetical protein